MSRTFDLADRLIHYTLVYLVRYGESPVADLFVAMKKDLKFSEWEKVVYKKNRTPRWERMTFSFSIDLTKAGWIIKKRKIWDITPAGRKALREIKDPTKLRLEAKRLFDIWNAIPREELLRRKAAARAEKEKLKKKKRL